MNLRKILARNASGNLLRGVSGAVLALALPPFLTRSMPVAEFSAWALILQLAAYVNYFDVGIQVALARLIAHTHEREEFELRNEVVTSGVAILVISASIAMLIAGLVTWQLPHIYPSIPQGLLPQVQAGLLIIAGALAISLPSSTYTGVLVGLNRSDSSGAIAAITRLLGGIAVVLLARRSEPLSIIAASLGLFYLVNAVLQMFAAHRHCPGLIVAPRLISSLRIKTLAADCGYISAWNIGMLLVSGLDIALVGRFSFKDLGAYSVASTLILFVTGINGAIFAAMLAPIATLHAQAKHQQIGRLVLKSTRIGIYITILTCLPLLFAGKVILAHWVTPAYGRTAWPILFVLIIANIIRLAANPYSVAVLATGQQKIVVISPIIEGVTNLTFSIILGIRLGVMGVAFGTLIGAIIGLASVVIFFVPRTGEIPIRRKTFFQDGLLKPAFSVLPALLGLGYLSTSGYSTKTLIFSLAGLIISWKLGLRTKRSSPCHLEMFHDE